MEKEMLEIGFRKFRTKVVIFALSVAVVIDFLAFIQMGVL